MNVTRKTELSANVVAFCRYLRGQGIAVGPQEQADALQALSVMPIGNRQVFRLALRATLTRSQKDQERFDELFPRYWEELRRAADSKLKAGDPAGNLRHPEEPQAGATPGLTSLRDWRSDRQPQEDAGMAAYSPVEVLLKKDFALFGQEELPRVMELIAAIARSLATRYSRRFEADPGAKRFDLRRTMRRNLRRGGEIVELSFRRRRLQRLQLVMLCDVSKSMDLYSRFLMQFIYAFQSACREIETFVFSTSLHRITRELQGQSFRECLQQLSESVPDWSGGTRIGTSLSTFVSEYGPRLLNDRSVVIILSDGWDTGEVELLKGSMESIHRRARRVIWLNPLAGSPQFEPTVRGMQAAWPSIDLFAPVHNVESLRRLAGYLARRSGSGLRYRFNPFA